MVPMNRIDGNPLEDLDVLEDVLRHGSLLSLRSLPAGDRHGQYPCNRRRSQPHTDRPSHVPLSIPARIIAALEGLSRANNKWRSFTLPFGR